MAAMSRTEAVVPEGAAQSSGHINGFRTLPISHRIIQVKRL